MRWLEFIFLTLVFVFQLFLLYNQYELGEDLDRAKMLAVTSIMVSARDQKELADCKCSSDRDNPIMVWK